MGGDFVFHQISQVCPHKLLLLLTVTQISGKPLEVGSYTERTVIQMIDRVAGVQPLSVTIVNVNEAIVQFKEDDLIISVSQLIQGLMSWKGQSVNVSCVISIKRILLSIIQEGEGIRNKQKELEKKQQLIRDEAREQW